MDAVNQYGPTVLPVAGAGIGTLLGGPMGGLLGTSIGSSVGNLWTNHQNLEFQRDVQNYNKRLQKDIFAREDSSIVRRVNDLHNAGLSPVLAAGQGASAGSPISLRALERSQNPDVASMIFSLLKMREDIRQTMTQTQLSQQQIEQSREYTNKIKTDNWRNGIEAMIASEDYKRYKALGVNPRNASFIGKTASDVITGTGATLKTAADQIKSGWNTYDAEMMKIQRKLEEGVKSLFNK